MALFNNFSSDIGIDLGTCNTLVHVKGKGIVLTEPSVVAIDHESKQVVAVGTEAKRMLWKTPHTIEAVRPLRDGVIADFEMTEQMIRHFIMQVAPRRWFVKPRMVIGIPAGATEVEKRAVQESAEQAGAREVFVIEESIAAAVGARSADHGAGRPHDLRHRRRHHGSFGHLARRHGRVECHPYRRRRVR